jgi:uncharacterized protein YggE
MKSEFVLALLIGLIVLASSALAQFDTPSHVIRVRADAEIKAIPDKAIIVLGVQSRDSLMSIAKSRNDNMTIKMIEIAKKFGVQDSDISTEYYTVEPKYTDYKIGRAHV